MTKVPQSTIHGSREIMRPRVALAIDPSQSKKQTTAPEIHVPNVPRNQGPIAAKNASNASIHGGNGAHVEAPWEPLMGGCIDGGASPGLMDCSSTCWKPTPADGIGGDCGGNGSFECSHFDAKGGIAVMLHPLRATR